MSDRERRVDFRVAMDETICAISTPPGEGGIGIVRLSGPESVMLTERIFRSARAGALREAPTHTLQHGHILDPTTGERIDEVIVSVMRGPRSYTREDVVEINGHGGPVLLHRILELLIRHGARLAEPGEFTKRAFLNGRLDLTQAEAVMDLIRAKTDAGCRAAMKRLEGALGREVQSVRDALSALLANIEAAIDFPEEGLEILPRSKATEDVRNALSGVQKLIDSAEEGRILQEGLATVIIGRPSMRGGVPVLSRPSLKPSSSRFSEARSAAFSPILPAGKRSRPIWISPRRKVPVVMITAPA